MNVEAAPRVLVVEDEEAIAEGLLFNLQRKHYEVDLARNGREAIDRAGAKRYDLILLDVRLPEVDGFEVCQTLRTAGQLHADPHADGAGTSPTMSSTV